MEGETPREGGSEGGRKGGGMGLGGVGAHWGGETGRQTDR